MQLAVQSAKVETGSEAEENLRRETHLECAMARLEGVVVGQYRYYQGHMTIEDYKAARICICWQECWCAKMCTRFGDLRCPCSNDLLLNND